MSSGVKGLGANPGNDTHHLCNMMGIKKKKASLWLSAQGG